MKPDKGNSYVKVRARRQPKGTMTHKRSLPAWPKRRKNWREESLFCCNLELLLQLL